MNRPRRHIIRPALLAALLALAGLSLLSACGGSPPVYVQQYMLAYAPPAPAGVKALPAAIKVERFGALPQFATQRMLYMPGSYEVGYYANHRWQGYPSDMVAGLLARDLADSGRFSAVFGPASPQMPRFVVEGGLVKFWEDDRAGGPEAQLEVVITLLDIQQGETVKRVMFQKKYQATRNMAAKKAQNLAQSLSQGMAQISPQVAKDVYMAVARRLTQGQPPLETPTP